MHAFDAQFQRALDAAEFQNFSSGSQCGCAALQASAAGTANAMNEIFGDLWHIVINYVRNIVDVQAAGGNIGRHQHLESPSWKPLKAALRWDCERSPWIIAGAESVANEFIGEALSAALGASEDQGLAGLFVKQLPKHIEFFARTNFVSSQFARSRPA